MDIFIYSVFSLLLLVRRFFPKNYRLFVFLFLGFVKNN